MHKTSRPLRHLMAASALMALLHSPVHADAVRAEVGRPLQQASELLKAGKGREALAKVREAEAVSGLTPAESLTVNRMKAAAAQRAGDNATAIAALESVYPRVSGTEQNQIAEQLASAHAQGKNNAAAADWLKKATAGGYSSATTKQLQAYLQGASGDYNAIAKDTAAAITTHWNFSTLAGGGENNSCFADKSRVVGVVTTSATAMEPATPEFKNGLLTYKVAGLHYAPDGKTLNEGSYDLVMRSDVARCLYGFSKAPLSATVSVIGEGGENKVATTVVSEKDGWLKLAAYGFTFSSPTISVKLSQAKAPAKKTTITCVKGKLTKKVTAVGPKCPAGYKKK